MDVKVSCGHNHTIVPSIISPFLRSVKFTASGNYDVFSQQEWCVEMGQETFNSTRVRATLAKSDIGPCFLQEQTGVHTEQKILMLFVNRSLDHCCAILNERQNAAPIVSHNLHYHCLLLCTWLHNFAFFPPPCSQNNARQQDYKKAGVLLQNVLSSNIIRL